MRGEAERCEARWINDIAYSASLSWVPKEPTVGGGEDGIVRSMSGSLEE